MSECGFRTRLRHSYSEGATMGCSSPTNTKTMATENAHSTLGGQSFLTFFFFKHAANGSRLGEGGDFTTNDHMRHTLQNLQKVVIRGTEAPLLPNRC